MAKKEKITTLKDVIYRLYMSQTDMYQALVYARELQKRELNSLTLISNPEDNVIFCALVEAFVVSYCRPFKRSRDIRNNFEGSSVRSVMNSLVPGAYMSLHQTILEFRDGFYAHSDMTKLNPRYHEPNMVDQSDSYSSWDEDLINRSEELAAIVLPNITIKIEEFESLSRKIQGLDSTSC